jgi:hypothetical protein
MAKCSQCRDKDVELLTRWERIRYWLFFHINTTLFPQDYDDLKNDRYTQGFSDGNLKGFESGKTRAETAFAKYNPVQVPKTESREELNKLLTPVDEKLIVSFDSKAGAIFIGGERADDGRLTNLKSEANFLMESDIWNILNQTIRELAQRAMFVDGTSIESMQKGRSMLFLLDSQKKIVDIFRSYAQKKPS